jgi:hypothetical protein
MHLRDDDSAIPANIVVVRKGEIETIEPHVHGISPAPVCEWELDLAVVELLDVVTLAGSSGHSGSLDDLQHQQQAAHTQFSKDTTDTCTANSQHK